MNRGQKIVKDTIAYTIGNFGSKILSYVMVLVYTHIIASSELGYYDVVITTVSLLQPIVLMMFDDGVYRWMVDDSQSDKRVVIATCLKTVALTTALSTAVLFLCDLKFHVRYVSAIALYFASGMLYQLLLNSIRGLGNSNLYAASGIINSLLLLIFEMGGLLLLGMGVEALFYAKAFANLITVLFLYTRQAELRGVLRVPFNRALAKDVTKYSTPLIPNNICWWIVNSSDRYIIMFFLGTAANGIYSVSNKFPTIISTVTGIMYFALQESIIREYQSPDRNDFYSDVFRKYYLVLFSLVICGIPATRIVIEWFTGADYTTAWMYTGFLFLSTVYSALSGLLGIGYQISKETARSVKSTVGAAAINIAVNIAFIRSFGLHAASFSTLISYVFLLMVRLKHSKKYFKIDLNVREFLSLNVVAFVTLIATFLVPKGSWCIPLTMAAAAYALVKNRDLLMPIMERVRSMKKR